MPLHALRSTTTTLSPAPEQPSGTGAPTNRRIPKPFANVAAIAVAIMLATVLGACSNQSNRGAQIVNNARSQIGSNYVYGGASPGGFDCSGLTQWAHARAGIGIPRTVADQRAAARPVSQSGAQPGDLIFFGTYHVGVYTGGGRIVDAPHSGSRVMERAIWTSDYTVGRFW